MDYSPMDYSPMDYSPMDYSRCIQCLFVIAIRMMLRGPSVLPILLGVALCAPGMALASPPHDEQHEARRELRAGNVHSLRDIEREVLPTMPGSQYLGPEYDPEAMAYRLKFIRDGHVLFVDVDARTGQVLSRSR